MNKYDYFPGDWQKRFKFGNSRYIGLGQYRLNVNTSHTYDMGHSI